MANSFIRPITTSPIAGSIFFVGLVIAVTIGLAIFCLTFGAGLVLAFICQERPAFNVIMSARVSSRRSQHFIA